MSGATNHLAVIAAAETALVASAGQWQAAAVAPPWAYAVVASKFLAASSPHSLGLFCAHDAEASRYFEQTAAGFAAVFRPRDIRILQSISTAALAAPPTGTTLRNVRYRDVMAADIVVHAGNQVEESKPRPGSHVVWIAPSPPPFSAALEHPGAIFAAVALQPSDAVASLTAPWVRLGDIVAGRIDGRQLDEITVTWICTNAM